MNDLREALDQISLNELAQRARVATATITRLKLRGEFTRTSASGRIRHVLVADGLWPKDGEAALAQADLPMVDPVHTQIKQAELEKKVQEVRRLTLLNNLAEEKSILVEDVKSRIGSAGALLRTGADGARRSIEVACCDGCRDAVVTEFDAAIGATVEAVARALEGR